MEKFEFASDAWIAELKKLIVKYAAEAGPNTNLSICEVFNNVPKNIDKHGTGTLAWHCIIKNGKLVTFEETPIDVADVRTEHEYDFVLPVAKMVYTPEKMGEVNDYMAKGLADGRSKSTSTNREAVPANFFGMHNELAVRTL